MKFDGFINISKGVRNIDHFVPRTSIKKAIDSNLTRFSGSLLDVGCGKMPYRNYICSNSAVSNYTGVDIQTGHSAYHDDILPDIFWDGVTLPVANDSYDTIICTEVLEHVPDTENLLREIFRVLKPGGVFFFTTPFLWPLHDVPYDQKRLTPFAMQNYLKAAGFTQHEVKALGGWHASMALMLAVWVRRAGMPKVVRSVLSNLLRPIIILLYRKDSPSEIFYESEMITGIYGTASKD